MHRITLKGKLTFKNPFATCNMTLQLTLKNMSSLHLTKFDALSEITFSKMQVSHGKKNVFP